ncbi:NECAP-like protein [Dirofilaria immitis]
MADEYESVCLVKPEVFVYRIPPLTSSRGHKAADWKLDEPDWTGRMRLVAVGSKLELRLEDKISGQLFAKCPIDEYPGLSIESVLDSSRYFVVRLKNDNGQTAFIGLGFADRSDSFDLNVSLQEHFKYIEKSAEFCKEQVKDQPKLDLGFKEGQTITINFGKKTSTNPQQTRASSSDTSSNSGGFPLLPPPPSATSPITQRSRNISGTRTEGEKRKEFLWFFHFAGMAYRFANEKAHIRLLNEYSELKKDPVPGVVAKPLDESLLLWGYVIRGAKDTPYDGGMYYGELEFSNDFPSIPPHVLMYTPNGRFIPGERICVSISAFHPTNWNPSWTVGTFLHCFAHFMMFDEKRMGMGATRTSTEQKRLFAKQSMSYNKTNKNFMKAFGEKPFDPDDSENKTRASADLDTDDEEESELSNYSFSESDDEGLRSFLKWKF